MTENYDEQMTVYGDDQENSSLDEYNEPSNYNTENHYFNSNSFENNIENNILINCTLKSDKTNSETSNSEDNNWRKLSETLDALNKAASGGTSLVKDSYQIMLKDEFNKSLTMQKGFDKAKMLGDKLQVLDFGLSSIEYFNAIIPNEGNKYNPNYRTAFAVSFNSLLSLALSAEALTFPILGVPMVLTIPIISKQNQWGERIYDQLYNINK